MTSKSKDIQTIDNMLLVLREGWMDATPPMKGKWMGKINGLLDQRLLLMKANSTTNTTRP